MWDTPLGELAVDMDLVMQIRAVAAENGSWPMGIAGLGEAPIQIIEAKKLFFEVDKQKELEQWALEIQLPIIKSIADDLGIKIKIVPMYIGVVDDAFLLRIDRSIRGLF